MTMINNLKNIHSAADMMFKPPQPVFANKLLLSWRSSSSRGITNEASLKCRHEYNEAIEHPAEDFYSMTKEVIKNVPTKSSVPPPHKRDSRPPRDNRRDSRDNRHDRTDNRPKNPPRQDRPSKFSSAPESKNIKSLPQQVEVSPTKESDIMEDVGTVHSPVKPVAPRKRSLPEDIELNEPEQKKFKADPEIKPVASEVKKEEESSAPPPIVFNKIVAPPPDPDEIAKKKKQQQQQQQNRGNKRNDNKNRHQDNNKNQYNNDAAKKKRTNNNNRKNRKSN